MYNSIKIGSMTEEGMKNIKTSKKKNSVMTVEQEIVLLFSRHFVVRTGKGYSLVLEYSSPRSEYLYEVVASPVVRYFCLLKQKIGKISSCSLDLQNKTIGGF